MKLLDSIRSRGSHDRRVELYQGDLTDVSAQDAFDLLVVSAFPDDYVPTYGSLIGALDEKGLSVGRLARAKERDLRANYSCWLSAELPPRDGLRFRRLLCFEPLVRGRPPEVVGDIFRALVPILAEHEEIKTIALPMVAAGDQGYSVDEILIPLLDAGLHSLEEGLPLDRIKIVAYSKDTADDAATLFAKHKAEHAQSDPPRTERRVDYDVLFSYSRANTFECQVMEMALRKQRADIRIFVDRNEIDIGVAWQGAIFDSIARCRKLVALLSPEYAVSKVCQDEFNLAWMQGRKIGRNIIFPVYLYTADLPICMEALNHIDCREGDRSRLAEASHRLLAALDADEGKPAPPVGEGPGDTGDARAAPRG